MLCIGWEINKKETRTYRGGRMNGGKIKEGEKK
jgi:hypothetical protein